MPIVLFAINCKFNYFILYCMNLVYYHILSILINFSHLFLVCYLNCI